MIEEAKLMNLFNWTYKVTKTFLKNLNNFDQHFTSYLTEMQMDMAIYKYLEIKLNVIVQKPIVLMNASKVKLSN